MDIPTYTEESQKEKFDRGITNAWPRIYRFINGIFYSVIRIIRDGIIRTLQQIFH